MQENYSRKNEARKKGLQLKTRTSWNTYFDVGEGGDCIQKKGKKRLNNKITQIEENHRRNETKKFFEGIRNYKQQVTLPTICKDAKDNVISNQI
jgi:hypothetical protein